LLGVAREAREAIAKGSHGRGGVRFAKKGFLIKNPANTLVKKAYFHGRPATYRLMHLGSF